MTWLTPGITREEAQKAADKNCKTCEGKGFLLVPEIGDELACLCTIKGLMEKKLSEKEAINSS